MEVKRIALTGRLERMLIRCKLVEEIIRGADK
jgi:hypothetical protein